MFRQIYAVAFAALASFGGLKLSMAEEPNAVGDNEPKAANGEQQITNSIAMKLVLVPSGEFMMGNGESAEKTDTYFKKTYPVFDRPTEQFTDEHPQHRVKITKPFYLGMYHVTRGQFRQFVKDTGYRTDAEKSRPGAWGLDPKTKKRVFDKDWSWRNVGFPQTDEHPVVEVSWNDATAFCKWLSRKESKNYRLPTEAEWEYACRAGTKTRYYSGNNPETLTKVGNVADASFRAEFPDLNECANKANDGFVFTASVGQFTPNAFGLYDMHGNAFQWCNDWYSENYYGISPIDDPKGPTTGDLRVARGGGWSSPPWFTPSTERIGAPPSERVDNRGFRVARSQ